MKQKRQNRVNCKKHQKEYTWWRKGLVGEGKSNRKNKFHKAEKGT